MDKEAIMRHVIALAFGIVLTFGTATAYAAALSTGVSPDRSAPKEEALGHALVTEGAKVTIAFTIAIPDTHETITREVSEYVAGDDQVIPALQKELMGMKAGERKRVELQPEEAFGPYDEQKKIKLPRGILPSTARVGVVYQTPQGETFTVVGLSDDTAVADFNHPLAGKHVILDVEVLQVEQHS
jgi:FKBP-type peptidyl-prolyl cis-trans isomerase 2